MLQLSDNSTMDEINIVVNAFVFQSNGVKISFHESFLHLKWKNCTIFKAFDLLCSQDKISNNFIRHCINS